MKYLEGETLDAYVLRKTAQSETLPLNQVVALLSRAAVALDYAHQNGVIHRDIKPSNIFLVKSGGKLHVQIIDFGLADEIRTSMTRVSQARVEVSGTRPYRSPEQWRGRTQSAATDQYALAVVAYELLAGHVPFKNSDVALLRLAVMNDLPEPIPTISDSANAVLRKALSKDAADRFATCRDFIAALNEKWTTGGEDEEEEEEEEEESVPFALSEVPRWGWALAGCMLAAVLLGVLVWGTGNRNKPVPLPAETSTVAPAQERGANAAPLATSQTTATPRAAQTTQTQRQAGDRMTLTIKGVEYAFRRCPPGTFMMGSPPNEANRRDNERQHEVILTRGFWMLETEVTQEMWRSVMGNNPSRFRGDKRPVETVSWHDCQEFITKLNDEIASGGHKSLVSNGGLTPAAHKFSLPTAYHFGKIAVPKQKCYNDTMLLNKIIAKHGCGKESLTPILQDLQKEYTHIPHEILCEVCTKTGITVADLFTVPAFYDQFRLAPKSRKREILADKCKGCTVCIKKCPADAIIGERKMPHKIVAEKCNGCAECAKACKFGAIIEQINAAPIVSEMPMLEEIVDSTKKRHELVCNPAHQVAVVRVGIGSCCKMKNSVLVLNEVIKTIREWDLDIQVDATGCTGMCSRTPILETIDRRGVSTFYADVREEDVPFLLLKDYKPKRVFMRVRHSIERCLETLWCGECADSSSEHALNVITESRQDFLKHQHLLATKDGGLFNPNRLSDYRNHGGFEALRRVMNSVSPPEIIVKVKQSGLRERNGESTHTHIKWSEAANAGGTTKCVVCQGGETVKDMMLLESFPFRIIEGITIAAKAVGASRGVLHIGTKYPLAAERVRWALDSCYENHLLGKNILDSDFSFDLSIQTKLDIVEQPVLTSDVETFALIPAILISEEGLTRFAQLGTVNCRGTKVFYLTGKVRRSGLIEVPMGITLRQIVEEIGGGIQQSAARQLVPPLAERRTFKAVQIGGSSGGCVPEYLADTPVDFETLTAFGAIMGAGSLIVLDDHDCMVDIARSFMKLTREQSCGVCAFCQTESQKMLDILNRLCMGLGKSEDLETLETLSKRIKSESVCGLGKVTPNSVLYSLRYFRSEYEAHVHGKCPAGKCPALIEYRIDASCSGCSICVQHCPVSAIPLTPYRRHCINTSICSKCDACRKNCPQNAVSVVPQS